MAALPCSLARLSGLAMASSPRPQLRGATRSLSLSVRASPRNQRKLLGSFVGLRRLHGVGEQRVESSSHVRTRHAAHHECPHWLNPQAAWKQEILWTKVPISESKRVTEELCTVKLDISDNEELKKGFTKPGQFVQVKVGTGKPTFLAIASTPKVAEEEGFLEFLIKDVEGTTAGEVCALKAGEEVEVSQPMGRGFPLDRLVPAENYPTVLIFATGSGISPIRSVIEHGFEAGQRTDVRLYYGAESLSKMAYKDLFEAWEASGVKVIPVLSNPGPDWTGETGFVQAAYRRAKNVQEPAKAGALLCGQKEMAEEVTGMLVEDGFAKETILLNF